MFPSTEVMKTASKTDVPLKNVPLSSLTNFEEIKVYELLDSEVLTKENVIIL